MMAKDLESIVPIARQMVFRELETCGLPNEVIKFVPSVTTGRQRLFADTNESSESFGKNKRGFEYCFHFEIEKSGLCYFEFDWAGRGKIKRNGGL